MSDNTQLNPGSGGDIVAADDIDGIKYQRVKLTLGADGINDGDLSAENPLPVSLAAVAVSNLPAVQAVSGAFYQEMQPVSLTTAPLPAGAAQDTTLQAMRDLNDTMLYMLSAILEKMPRVTGNDQAVVSIEAGNVGITGTPTVNVTTLSNITSIGGKQAAQMPDAISQLGALHLYQNITVS
jgi:hypothetical protein